MTWIIQNRVTVVLPFLRRWEGAIRVGVMESGFVFDRRIFCMKAQAEASHYVIPAPSSHIYSPAFSHSDVLPSPHSRRVLNKGHDQRYRSLECYGLNSEHHHPSGIKLGQPQHYLGAHKPPEHALTPRPMEVQIGWLTSAPLYCPARCDRQRSKPVCRTR
jgi:hypothetical protein